MRLDSLGNLEKDAKQLELDEHLVFFYGLLE